MVLLLVQNVIVQVTAETRLHCYTLTLVTHCGMNMNIGHRHFAGGRCKIYIC